LTGNRPVSLFHIFPAFQLGGQQVRLVEIMRGLGEGYRHHILSLCDDVSASVLCDVETAEIEALPLKKSRSVSPGNIRRLIRRLRSFDPDLVCTYNWGSLEGAIANRLSLCRPHIHYEDGFGPDETVDRQKPQRVWARRAILRKSEIVVPSRTLRDLALKKWGFRERQIVYIPNGVDLERFRAARDYSAPAPVVGSVGALRREKNYHRLINVFTAIEAPSARLEIVGSGPERSALVEAATQALNSRITLSGATTAPENAYARFDIFALSSDTEQMPLSLIEAMAAGLPVVATDVGDIKDMVSEENREFIVDRDDEGSYALALGRLIEDCNARETLGRANLEKARAAFSLDDMIQAHARLYSEMTGAGPKA